MRRSLFLLALPAALVLGCEPVTAPVDATVPLQNVSQKSSDEIHAITESAAVRVSGDAVLLHLNGETFELGAGEAYLIGQTLSMVGAETLPGEIAEELPPPRGGSRCEPPPPGSGALMIEGRLFGKCPPPPPPLRMSPRFLDKLVAGAAEVVEVPEDLRWDEIPGGFVADF